MDLQKIVDAAAKLQSAQIELASAVRSSNASVNAYLQIGSAKFPLSPSCRSRCIHALIDSLEARLHHAEHVLHQCVIHLATFSLQSRQGQPKDN